MRIWSLFALRCCLRFASSAVHLVATVALAAFKSRAALQLENVALRHQLGVLHRSVKKPKLATPDRLLWSRLCGVWGNWGSALIIVKPETVIHLAPPGLSAFLEVENPSLPAWSLQRSERRSPGKSNE